VTVLLGSAPEPGIAVAFQDATGVVTATATTDALGQVSQLVTAGSQVTVAFGTATSPSLVTIQDVSPGDVLTFVDGSSQSTSDETVAPTLPAPTWDAAGSSETVYAGRCSTELPSTLYVNPECAALGEYPLLAIAEDEVGNEIAYTYQKGNPLAPDGGLPDDAGAFPVTVTRGWSTSSVQQTVIATNAPAPPTDAGSVSQGSQLTFTEVASGVPRSGDAFENGSTDAGAPIEVFTAHPGYADFVQTGAVYTLGTDFGNIDSVLAAATRSDPATTSQSASFDFSTLPLITAASVDATDGGTVAQPNVTWTSGGSLAATNGIFIELQWYSPPVDGGPNVNGTWTILAPPTSTNVRAPALPSSMAAPTTGTTYSSPPRVGAVQAPFLPGYGGLRASFGSLPFFPNNNYELSIPPLPVSGTLYVTGIFPNEG
jgi:hypothetical protein